jgi:hypothetical protein
MDRSQQRHASLVEFIERARSKGASDEMLAVLLGRRGWSRREIDDAFTAVYERMTGLDLPARTGRMESAREAFLYLLSFGTLATWTLGLGTLLFTIIHLHFPDPVTAPQDHNARFAMAGSMASLIVAYPVYFATMWLLVRGIAAEPEKLESGVRKWLSYIALLLAAAIVIGDLVTFLSYFLRGELTACFILKTLTVFVIAGGVFSYYYLWLERPEERRSE